MLHYYYLIEANRVVDQNSLIYWVGVGTSKQANSDFLFLTAYAVEHGYYFEPSNHVNSQFVKRVRESVNMSLSNFQVVNARDLVRSIRASLRMPLNSAALAASHHVRKVFNTDYRISTNLSASSRNAAQEANVKNLIK